MGRGTGTWEVLRVLEYVLHIVSSTPSKLVGICRDARKMYLDKRAPFSLFASRTQD